MLDLMSAAAPLKISHCRLASLVAYTASCVEQSLVVSRPFSSSLVLAYSYQVSRGECH